MDRSLRLAVVAGDAFEIEGDVLVLKYARTLFGLDRAVHDRLRRHGPVPLPETDQDAVLPSHGELKVRAVQFVGVERLGHFKYPEIRDFARRSLASLALRRPDARHVVFTIHGPGYGLDEMEAFKSELAGIIEAVAAGTVPASLESITFVESDGGRADRLARTLAQLFPGSGLGLAGAATMAALPAESQQALRSVGEGSADKPHVFVAMPFAAEWDDVYHYGIQGAANSAGLLCERADLSSFTGDVMNWVKDRIASARLMVADLSSANPNVYLEVGYAWGCRVPTVLLVRDPEELRFDVRGQRCIVYNSIRQLEETLGDELAALGHVEGLRG